MVLTNEEALDLIHLQPQSVVHSEQNVNLSSFVSLKKTSLGKHSYHACFFFFFRVSDRKFEKGASWMDPESTRNRTHERYNTTRQCCSHFETTFLLTLYRLVEQLLLLFFFILFTFVRLRENGYDGLDLLEIQSVVKES